MSHRQEEGTTARGGLPISSFPVSTSFLPAALSVLSLSPDLSRKITSTCNSVATCNASLGRYRKRHSRPLVTTALKRRSIFRRCVSPVLYTPRRLSPRGGPRLSRRSPPLPRAISHCAQGEAELSPPLFFVPAFRPSTARPVPVSSSLVS